MARASTWSWATSRSRSCDTAARSSAKTKPRFRPLVVASYLLYMAKVVECAPATTGKASAATTKAAPAPTTVVGLRVPNRRLFRAEIVRADAVQRDLLDVRGERFGAGHRGG